MLRRPTVQVSPVWRARAQIVHSRTMTAPAPVKQAAIGRALREAKKHGAKRVRVEPSGVIDIVLDDGQMELPDNQPQEEQPRRAMYKTRAVPKEKVVL